MTPSSLDALLAEWVRLEAEIRDLHQQPMSDANDERCQTIVDRQVDIELTVYRTPADSIRDMLLKLQFMVRDGETGLPPDLRIEEAYSLPHEEGKGILRHAIAGLWVDAKRLSEAAPA